MLLYGIWVNLALISRILEVCTIRRFSMFIQSEAWPLNPHSTLRNFAVARYHPFVGILGELFCCRPSWIMGNWTRCLQISTYLCNPPKLFGGIFSHQITIFLGEMDGFPHLPLKPWGLRRQRFRCKVADSRGRHVVPSSQSVEAFTIWLSSCLQWVWVWYN